MKVFIAHKEMARLSWPGWVDQILKPHTREPSPILVLTGLHIKQLHYVGRDQRHCQTATILPLD